MRTSPPSPAPWAPVEPPTSPWLFPTPGQLARTGREDLVAVGADLEPGTLLSAYRAGLFPMPVGDGTLSWWSPDPRAVLPLDGLRVSRSLRRSCRRFEVRVDTDFAGVVAACADPQRPQGWIDDGIAAAYLRLHELGWAHSVECWREGVLVGGLYGVCVGGLFAGESMFHRETDASKVALVALVRLLDDGLDRVLDVQWATDHLISLGVVEIRRAAYLARLAEVLATPASSAFAGPAVRGTDDGEGPR